MSSGQRNSNESTNFFDRIARQLSAPIPADQPKPMWRWIGEKIFQGIETVGEGVVSVLGLDDSAYQDVLDGMTESEMRAAEEVQREREMEYETHMARRRLEAQYPVDEERGESEQRPAEDTNNNNNNEDQNTAKESSLVQETSAVDEPEIDLQSVEVSL